MKKTKIILCSLLFTILLLFTLTSFEMFMSTLLLLTSFPLFYHKIKKKNNLNLLYQKIHPFDKILYFLIASLTSTAIYEKYYQKNPLWMNGNVFHLAEIVYYFIIITIFFTLSIITKQPQSTENTSPKKRSKIIIDYALFFMLMLSLLARNIFIYATGGLPPINWPHNEDSAHETFDKTVNDTFKEDTNKILPSPQNH